MEKDLKAITENLASHTKRYAISYFVEYYTRYDPKRGRSVYRGHLSEKEKHAIAEEKLEEFFNNSVARQANSVIEYLIVWSMRDIDWPEGWMDEDDWGYGAHLLYALYKYLLNFEPIAEVSGQSPSEMFFTVLMEYRFLCFLHGNAYRKWSIKDDAIMASSKGGKRKKTKPGFEMAIRELFNKRPNTTRESVLEHYQRYDKNNPYKVGKYSIYYSEEDGHFHQTAPDEKPQKISESTFLSYCTRVAPLRGRIQ